MNPETQRIAIAEACGWKWHGDESWPKNPDSFYWRRGARIYQQLPNYLNDLNAMHEAEKILPEELHTRYAATIDDINEALPRDREGPSWFGLTTATAAQRAEAFLRTLGKWDDSK